LAASNGGKVGVFIGGLLPAKPGSALDGAQDADVAAAAADIVVERGGDLSPRRRRVTVEQGLGRDDDARQAIAALPSLLVEKGLLQGMRPLPAAEPFDREDFLASDCRQGLATGLFRAAVDQDHAAAALFLAAAEFRSDKAQVIAQNVEERRIAIGGDADGAAVHGEGGWLHRPSHRREADGRDRRQPHLGHHPAVAAVFGDP
jgi:hypothetical protein